MFPTDEDPMSETSWESIPPTTRCKINTLYPKFNFIKTHFNNAIKEYFTAIEISNFPCGNKKKIHRSIVSLRQVKKRLFS